MARIIFDYHGIMACDEVTYYNNVYSMFLLCGVGMSKKSEYYYKLKSSKQILSRIKYWQLCANLCANTQKNHLQTNSVSG
jgi:hypothetical protein